MDLKKYISLIIMIAFFLQACASQELRSKRTGDIYKAEKISSRTEILYKIAATSPTQIKVTAQTDTYETYRRFYEEIEDVTTKKASWSSENTTSLIIRSAVSLGAYLLVYPFARGNSQDALNRCSYDGQTVSDGQYSKFSEYDELYNCSVQTETSKTGSYIKKDAEALINSRETFVTSGNVMVSINGSHVKDIAIKPDGTAEIDLFKFPELAKAKKDLNIEYRYQNAVLSTTLESAVTYAAKQILSEIRSKGWRRVAIVELNTYGMPEGFQESLLKEIELQHTQNNKENSVVETALIGKALKVLQADVSNILKPSSTGKTSDICKRFGDLTDADGIINGKIIKNQAAREKKRPDIFDIEGIRVDLKLIDIDYR